MYTVTFYDYDLELHSTVIIGHEQFTSKEKAIEYAKQVDHTISSRVVVKGNNGYDIIASGSRRHFTIK